MRRLFAPFTDWEHHVTGYLRRAASPLRPCLGFRYTQPRHLWQAAATGHRAEADEDRLVRVFCVESESTKFGKMVEQAYKN